MTSYLQACVKFFVSDQQVDAARAPVAGFDSTYDDQGTLGAAVAAGLDVVRKHASIGPPVLSVGKMEQMA